MFRSFYSKSLVFGRDSSTSKDSNARGKGLLGGGAGGRGAVPNCRLVAQGRKLEAGGSV